MLKPEIFATIMDFFASGFPVVTEAPVSSDTGGCVWVGVHDCVIVCVCAHMCGYSVWFVHGYVVYYKYHAYLEEMNY